MGARDINRRPMAWQGTLGQMKQEGTLLVQSCTGCGAWSELNLDTLIIAYGEGWAAWGRRPTCGRCGKRGHYMASPGRGTPFRPLLPGPAYDAARREFLRGFGFTKRDVARVKALAERCAEGRAVVALNDLDVPYRVGAALQSERHRPNGDHLGEWAGCDLLFWKMSGRELEHWQTRRRRPKGV